MRAVWGQASRPRLSFHAVSRQHLKASSRKNLAPSVFRTRAVTFSDAFGIFLAPFLAAATIVNLSWKEKQKKDWEKRFADIDREIEVLRARELDAWNSLQLSFALRKAARHERRSYSTAALARVQEASIAVSADGNSYEYPAASERQSNLGQARLQSRTKETRPDPVSSLGVHNLAHSPMRGGQDVSAPDTRPVDVPDWLWELERLIATKLALRMLLHPHLVDGQLLEDIGAVNVTPSQAQNVTGLLQHLQKVTKLESAAQKSSTYRLDRIGFGQHRFAHLLRESILEVSHKYQRGEISPIQLIEQISQLLLDAPEPPDIKVYTQLVEVLHTCRFTTFVPMVIDAIRRSRLLLDEIALVRIITNIAHCRDVEAFEWCLREVTKPTGRLKHSQRWEWRRIAGELLPVPSSSDPRLVRILATAALALEQISRAEAWAAVLDESGYQGSVNQDLIKSFMYYYTKHSNWDKGRSWILRVVQSDILTDVDAFRSFQDFQTLVFRMLSLCAACGKRSEYGQILGAATGAGIRPPAYDLGRPGMNNEQTKKTIDEWERIMDHHVLDRSLLNEEKISRFQQSLRSSELCRDGSTVDDSLPEGLKMQVIEAKRILEEQLRQSRTMQAKLQSTLDVYVTLSEDFHTRERSRMLGENGSHEQQIPHDVQLTELSQCRQKVDAEVHVRKVEDQSPSRQQRQAPRLKDEYGKASPQYRMHPTKDRRSNLHQVMTKSDDAQIKKLEEQVAHLTSLVQTLLNQPRGTSTSNLQVLPSQPDNITNPTTADPAFHLNLFTSPVNHPNFNAEDISESVYSSDSGYSSDYSTSSGPEKKMMKKKCTTRTTAIHQGENTLKVTPDRSSSQAPLRISNPAPASDQSTDSNSVRVRNADSAATEVFIHKYSLPTKSTGKLEKPFRLRNISPSNLLGS